MLAAILRDGVLKDIAAVRADAATAASGMSMLKVDVEHLLSMVEREEALAAEERADLLADRDKWKQLAETLGARGQLNTGWVDRKQIHYSFIVDDILLVAAHNPEQMIFYMCQRAYAELTQYVKEHY